ncbi:hypothetical protein [Pontibacter anaerobius]|uniref:Uncharacterized protein n=1 Tax=Pontibacter anaerobius TaxID=2993940 RepID=A0ABT3RDD3_9BACT|nr:hypothetical protein [Pontibacter anaerobius]MCX2739285.1 hypothetical protein [Pontibacter anaerobius]
MQKADYLFSFFMQQDFVSPAEAVAMLQLFALATASFPFFVFPELVLWSILHLPSLQAKVSMAKPAPIKPAIARVSAIFLFEQKG